MEEEEHLPNNLKFCLKIVEKSRSGGIWGGLGGLSEAILNDIGSKLACLGSCWCYVAHFGQQDGCQDGHLGDQERQDERRWRPRGGKIEPRWHPGLSRGLPGEKPYLLEVYVHSTPLPPHKAR